ncbi:hypothetical protein LA080_015548 [Diaporthe eres]|nr:hypothetical protein LA080_015548 [Diaporthe eres]
MAAVPPLTADEQEELQTMLNDFPEYQKYLQDRFSMYRGGEAGHTRSLGAIRTDFRNGARDRLNRIRARQVPRVNYTGRLTDNKRRLLAPEAELAREPYRTESGGGGGVDLEPAKQVVATDEFQRATAMMTAKKNFSFIKILGAGGNGMVVLWKWTPGGNPLEQGHYVVMKMSTVYDADEGRAEWEVVDDERKLTFGLLFMEFAKLGDLEHSLQRLARADRHMPPEALWLIFDCLVKACIAMEYPPRLVPAAAPLTKAGDFLPEVVPPGGQAAPVNGFRGVVHFDLDPKNIFLVGYDPRRRNPVLNPPHTQVPRFQEQFTGEWDLLDRDPEEGPQNAPPGTWPAWSRWPITSGPGRYSHRSNIWHIGLNMWCILLLQTPDFPAVAGRMKSEEPPLVPPATDVPIQDQRWTYGYRLIADDDEGREYQQKFTPALCEAIAKCMMARQEHRPDLNQLQADITIALGNPLPRLDARVRRFFGSEATPPVHWRSAYTGVDLLHMDPFDPYPDDPEGEEADSPSPNPRRRKRRRTRQAPLEDLAYRP